MAKNYLQRRWQNTKLHTWPGFTWHIGAVQVVGLLGAVVSSYLFGGSEFALAEIKSWGMFTFAWVGAANIAYLFVNWLMAPSRIEKEDALKIAELENKLSDVAKLEVRFRDEEPYRRIEGIKSTKRYWYFDLINTGPAVAENVGVRLLSIMPSPQVQNGALDYPFAPRRMRSADPFDSKINVNENVNFQIFEISGPTEPSEKERAWWHVQRFGSNGISDASLRLHDDEKWEMKYRVQAANAGEIVFTLLVRADKNDINIELQPT